MTPDQLADFSIWYGVILFMLSLLSMYLSWKQAEVKKDTREMKNTLIEIRDLLKDGKTRSS